MLHPFCVQLVSGLILILTLNQIHLHCLHSFVISFLWGFAEVGKFHCLCLGICLLVSLYLPFYNIYFGFVLIPSHSIFPQWKYCVFVRGFVVVDFHVFVKKCFSWSLSCCYLPAVSTADFDLDLGS
jgi:hypothetical protein